jgi:hypothetical protein
MSDRLAMKAEADDLGLQFPGNISNVNLARLLAEFKGEPAPNIETPPAGPAVKAVTAQEDYEEAQLATNDKRVEARKAIYANKRRKVAEARARAFKTQIVTLTNKDNRENDVMTTAYLSFQNQHFGLSKLVPLDIAVELETALIKIAESCTMTLHKDEIVNGRRTGNKVPIRVKKYAISYSRQDPE